VKVATIVDVARTAGVSVQTVSAVINGRAGASKATRERIRRIIKELDYQPSSLASGLRSQSTRTIGILIPTLTNPYWTEIVRGAEDTAHRNGYAVFLGNTESDPEKHDAYLQSLRRQRVVGIFFCDDVSYADEVDQVLASGVHVVINMAGWKPRGKAVSLAIDDEGAGFAATAHLLELGHRRVGFIGPWIESGVVVFGHNTGLPRRHGYERALRDLGVEPDPSMAVMGRYEVADGQSAARRLMESASPPTAIVAGNDLIAIGVLRVLKRLGKRVPEDVAVVGFDDIPLARLYEPPLTTIAQPLYDMGARAMQAILDRVQDPELPGGELIFPTSLIVRRSTVATAVDDEDEPQSGATRSGRAIGVGAEQSVVFREVPMQ
jgi:LacI family transcriptional regulator